MKLLILLGLIHPWDLLAPLLVMVLPTLLVMVVWLLLELVKLDLLVKEWDSTRDLVVDRLMELVMFVWDVGVRIRHMILLVRVPMTKELFKERVPMTKAKDQMNKKKMFVWDVGVRIWHIWNLEVRVPMTKAKVPMTKEIFKERVPMSKKLFVWNVILITQSKLHKTKERVPMAKAKDQINKKENDDSQS